MLVIIVMTIVYLVFVLAELKPKYNNDKKVFWVYTVILGFSYAVWMLYGLGVNIPSPVHPITGLIDTIFRVKG
ncbi:MAG: hypothetical protein ACOYU3_05450 [Bacillota bacterium]